MIASRTLARPDGLGSSSRSIEILYPGTNSFDAIRQHSELFAKTLRGAGIDAKVRAGGALTLAKRMYRGEGSIVIAYMPFSYGRWGFAPQLVFAAAMARVVAKKLRLVLLVHEAQVARVDARSWIMGTWQREQLRALTRISHHVFTSTEANCRVIRSLVSRSEPIHLPIGSTIPVADVDRAEMRESLGIGPSEFVVATLGGRHPSRALRHISAALSLLDSNGHNCVFLNLGNNPPFVPVPPGVRVVQPGALPDRIVSEYLSAADLYLGAFTDGVSTRRTSAAAALAHGLPLLGTEGASTDNLYREHPDALILVPVQDVEMFAATAVRLADDDSRRRALGKMAHEFYLAVLDWPVTARRFMRTLGLSRGEVE